ncbi:DUF1540 domain-containing protein [[Clostridium] dakarense]|uniref:DUF1540 domain-containing protein n=1 Tax=Faecalimicrobium dakarense TaxID=1301100 RepID=UPI0004BBB241|nr:DUF1540 domain-containing protein [[Clostridium] dakarense]
MTNSNLNCSATSCAYNNGGGCFAGGINVDGRQATTTGNTTCASYIDKASAGFTNSSNAYDSVGTRDIRCKATNCKYNVDEACKAEQVHINNDKNASCETFDLR